MKIKHYCLLILAFILLIVNISGQEIASEKSGQEDVLSRQVEIDLKHVTPREMFLYLMLQEDLRVGGVEPETDDSRRFDINIRLPLRDMMSYILAFDYRYYWEEDDGIIYLLSYEEPPLLNVRISKLKLENVNEGQIIEALKETPEFKSALLVLNLKDKSVSLSDIENDEWRYMDTWGLFSPSDEKNLSVDYENLNVKQILNKISHLPNRAFAWGYTERRCDNSDNENVKCFSIGVGVWK